MTHKALHPGSVVFSLAARRVVPGSLIWGLAFGVTVVASVAGFEAAYPTASSKAALAASLGSNAGLRALFGPARSINTVAGFTAWRTVGIASLIGATWGLLVATRALRGEEDAGRWEILVAGVTTRARATKDVVLGLAIGLLTLWSVTAVVVALDGSTRAAHFPLGSSLYFAVSLAAAPAMFLSIGVLSSQLAGSRRTATVISGGALGLSFVLKVLGDAGASTHWLIWSSPLGWVEELHPLTGPQPWVLMPIGAFALVTTTLALALAAGRDLGASVLARRDDRPSRNLLLAGPTRLTTRLVAPAATAWLAGLAALGLLFGLIAESASQALSGSARVSNVMSRFIGGRGGAAAYLGFTFVLIATVTELLAANQLVGISDEEASGRLDNLLVRRVSTWRWFGGRIAVSAATVVAGSLFAALGAWVGAALARTNGVTLVGVLEAGVNAAVAGLVVLGVGSVVYALWPRATSVVTYGLVAASYLIELVGSAIRANHYLLDLSILHHLAAAPAVPLNWAGSAILLAVGATGACAGIYRVVETGPRWRVDRASEAVRYE